MGKITESGHYKSLLIGFPDCPVGPILTLFSISEKSMTLLVDGPPLTSQLPFSEKEKNWLLMTSLEPFIPKGPTLKKLLTAAILPMGCWCSRV